MQLTASPADRSLMSPNKLIPYATDFIDEDEIIDVLKKAKARQAQNPARHAL